MAHLRWPAAVTAGRPPAGRRTGLLVLGILWCCAPAATGGTSDSGPSEAALDFAKRYCQEELLSGADELAAYSPARQAELDRHPGSWEFIPSGAPFTVVTSCEVKQVRRDGPRVFAQMVYRRVARCPGQSQVEAVPPDTETASLELVRRDGAWRVLDPPPPHISLEAAAQYFTRQAADDSLEWFRKASPQQLASRQRVVSAMETLLRIRCREAVRQESAQGTAREALGRLLDGHLYGETGRQALGYGCRDGTADTAGWPPGRSALVATGYRIKAFEVQGPKATAVVEYDVVAAVRAEEASRVERRDQVAVEMALADQGWRLHEQAMLYVSLDTARQAYQVQLARLTPEWFKQATEEQLAWWTRRKDAIKTLNLIDFALAKKARDH